MITQKSLQDIAENYVELGPTKLAEKYGVSRQRIHQIVSQLRKEGADIPYILEKLDYTSVARKLNNVDKSS